MASLDLSPNAAQRGPKIRRLNKLPVIIAITIVVIFCIVVVWGISSRGIFSARDLGIDPSGGAPASDFADRLKDGVPDGIIGAPREEVPPTTGPTAAAPPAPNPFQPYPVAEPSTAPIIDDWRVRLEREQQVQELRERHRQRMQSLQAQQAALDSPIVVSLGHTGDQLEPLSPAGPGSMGTHPNLSGLYAALGEAGGSQDPNGQAAKEAFFHQDPADLGYLPNGVMPAVSPYELKRGSVIPATLITGINSDLPGRIIAQVSQNVFDSATGHHLLIPQGSRLFGRYDSKVTYGQRRALVIWTDLVFPNGSTLQIGGMAGTDAEGYGGFSDLVDNKFFEVFGSAILVAALGAGMEMMLPEDQGQANSATDAARRSFAETFSQVADRTIGQNMHVQPTLEIRPGYIFNVLVDQDIIFPSAF